MRCSRPSLTAAAILLIQLSTMPTLLAQDKGPSAPTKLWAAQTSPTTVTLVWQLVAGAAGYNVFGPRPTSGNTGGGAALLARLGSNASRYVIQLAGAGLAHHYAVQAVDAKGRVSDKVEFNPVIPEAKQASAKTVPQPSSVTARETNSGEVRVDWSAVPGATGYFLGRSVAPGGFNTLCQLCPTETNYVDSGVTAGAKHIYTVSAITPFGTSKKTWSNEVTPTGGKAGVAGADAPPKGLSDLKATVVSPTSIRLSWEPGGGYTSFRITRRVGAMAAQLIATVAGTVFSFLDQFPPGSFGSVIRYEIEAIDAKGSTTKATVAIAPEKAATDSAAATPSPKGLSDLKAAVVSPTSVRLTWQPVTGYTSFRIKRRVGLTPSQVIAALAGTVFSFLDHLGPGSLAGGISYEVEAVDAKGSSTKATVAIAAEKAATDSAAATPSPKAPTGLKATVVSPTMIRLTWSPGLVGAMYRVMRQASGATQVIATLPGSVSNFLDHFPPGGAPGTIGYWIEAVDGKGTSEKITVTMDPDKGPGESEIDSLPRPRGRP